VTFPKGTNIKQPYDFIPFPLCCLQKLKNKPAHIDIMKEQLDNLQKGKERIEVIEVKETTNAIF
jgi:hypothetical protein